MAARLKTLELHGYKTFASKTNFEFSDKITAIVGPNGSGKSNIADSLRWVLGEQSFTLLRGRKTEDMIFAGSEHRPRAGMASASITFNNEDNWLPVDYAEVMITRRAYRDGQNEYLLNGQKVRLKEISELLGRCGLAERTYTIIGQGLVDSALSLRPEERRRFFEEAAGIELYRKRRNDSISRLETTRRNMDRVLDIINEIEPRLRSLQRQARRVQEYERIQADLEVLLREWYGYHWHRAQNELSHIQEVYHAHVKRLQETRQRYSAMEESLEGKRTEIETLRAKLNELHQQSSGLHQQIEKNNRDQAVLEERLRSTMRQTQQNQSDLTRLEEVQKTFNERLENLGEEKKRLEAEWHEAQQRVAQAHSNLAARRKERDTIDKALGEARRLLSAAETRQIQLKARQNELSGRLDSLRDNLEKQKSLMEKETLSARENEKKLQQARQRQEKVSVDYAELEESLQKHRESITRLDEERRKTLEDRAQLEGQRTKIKAQLDVLESAERSMSGMNQGPRFLLQAARDGKLKGKYTSINARLQVTPGYENAIAAVLGEHLDGVLLGENSEVEHALQLLETGEKGRTVLLPHHVERPVESLVLPDDPDIAGNALDFVNSIEEDLPLLRLLLGQVIVAKDRNAARRLVGKLPIQARVVTLTGEIYWGSGVIVAGQDGKEKVIARPRQIKDLKQALDETNTRIAQVSGQIEDQGKQLQSLRSAETEAQKKVRDTRSLLDQANREYERARLDQQQIHQRVEFQKNQIEILQKDMGRVDADLRQCVTNLSQIENEISTQRAEVKEKIADLNRLPLDDLQQEEAHWNTNAAVSARAVSDAEKRFSEYQREGTQNQQQMVVLAERLDAYAKSIEAMETEKNALRTSEKEISTTVEKLHQEIAPFEQELDKLQKQYDSFQNDQMNFRQMVAAAERDETQAQMNLTRQREKIDNLRRRVEDDFGLVAFEFANDISGQTPLPIQGMVEQLPVVKELSGNIEEEISRQRAQLRRMGPINPDAQREYQEVEERYEFLSTQLEDLKKADADLSQVIAELDELMRIEFLKTFDAVAAEFRQMFTRLFGGGSARLVLMDENNPGESGVEIEAQLPGRREQGLSLLSGGERCLTAVALVFSLLKISPTPFCVLDEVDAMLDESNVGRFCDLLSELGKNTQFVVVTHNRGTVQTADVIYGITMGRDSASQVISLKMDEVSDDMAQ